MSKTSILRRVDEIANAGQQAAAGTKNFSETQIRRAHELQSEAELLADVPEEEDLITKRHLRAARGVMSAGARLGATIDRLPIHKGDKPYHQKGYRRPKAIAFEATLPKLIETYGPFEAFDHMSNGQLVKYELKVIGNKIEVWNTVTGDREYPEASLLDTLREKIRDLDHVTDTPTTREDSGGEH